MDLRIDASPDLMVSDHPIITKCIKIGTQKVVKSRLQIEQSATNTQRLNMLSFVEMRSRAVLTNVMIHALGERHVPQFLKVAGKLDFRDDQEIDLLEVHQKLRTGVPGQIFRVRKDDQGGNL